MGRWLGQELRRLRLARKLSQREVAHALELPHMTYVSWETGKAVPPPARRPPLAQGLGITPQDLEDMVEEDEYEVFLRARPLSDEARAAVREFLKQVRERDRTAKGEP